MRKKILTLGVAALLAFSVALPAQAANSTVTFTSDGKMDTPASLGDAFEGMAPGEEKSLTIEVKNNNDHTADFYMSTEVLEALEKAGSAGAGYDVKLTAGGVTLYDSALGGYTGEVGSTAGLKEMNGALSDSILIATLNKGGKTDVILTIGLDGEALDNTAAINYANALGEIEFAFKAGYEDPTGGYTVYKIITKKGETKYVTIVDGKTPLAAKTGDNFSIIIAAVVVLAGVAFLVVGLRRKAAK